jgi:hypothetical protein
LGNKEEVIIYLYDEEEIKPEEEPNSKDEGTNDLGGQPKVALENGIAIQSTKPDNNNRI